MKRRDFLRISGTAGAAGLVATPASGFGRRFGRIFEDAESKYKRLVPELFEQTDKPVTHSQAIIIGSGFGGSIAAHRMAQAGIQSTVLERGFRWPTDPRREVHSPEMNPDGRAYWHRTEATHLTGIKWRFDKFAGMLDVTEYENIDVWRGACVGGGSKVFTGVMIQPERKYFEQIFEDTVDFDEMNNVYYPRVREMLNLSPLPNDLYYTSAFSHSRAWDNQSRMAGYEPEKIDGLWNWDVVRDEYKFSTRRSATAGESNHGNSNGAKFDLTQNYLKYAEESGLCNVFPGMTVTSITQRSDNLYVISVTQNDPMGKEIDSFELTCEYLVMAAGSIGTTELLLKARQTKTLPNLNNYIGTGWGSNGDTACLRSLGATIPAQHGTPSASKIHNEGDFGMPTTFENWYALHSPASPTMVGSLGMSFDMKNRGEFQYIQSQDKVDLVWPENANKEVIETARKMNNDIADKSFSKPGVLGLFDVNGSFTAHPLGGAILGKATDNYGRVKGYEKLYVMDGAMVNGSTGAVNPSLTISALAERNIEEILRQGK